MDKERFEKATIMLKNMGIKSSTGLDLNIDRVRSAYYNLRSVMGNYRYMRKDSWEYKMLNGKVEKNNIDNDTEEEA